MTALLFLAMLLGQITPVTTPKLGDIMYWDGKQWVEMKGGGGSGTIQHMPEPLICTDGFGRTMPCDSTSGDDVPAVQDKIVAWHGTKNCRSPYPDCTCETKGDVAICNQDTKCAVVQCEPDDHYETVVTCADKSRILLTAEDGTRWCHRVHP